LNSDDRSLLEARIGDARPVGVAWASCATCLGGLLASYLISETLIPMPRQVFPVAKPTAIVAICLAVLFVGLGLGFGLLRGRMWAWFGAVNGALLSIVLPTLFLAGWVRSGLSPRLAIALAPARATLIVLAAILLALLWLRSTRAWFASARRLRALPPEHLERYLLDG
jgi:hypothetical protein